MPDGQYQNWECLCHFMAHTFHPTQDYFNRFWVGESVIQQAFLGRQREVRIGIFFFFKGIGLKF